MSTTWKIRINGGPVQDFTTRSSIYRDAAFAALVMLDFDPADGERDLVEIWVPHLVEAGYGPSYYLRKNDENGNPVMCVAVPSRTPSE